MDRFNIDPELPAVVLIMNDFQNHTGVSFLQDKFLPNENKLIQTLSQEFQPARFTWRPAKEDADSLIINKAIEVAELHNTGIVVGQVINLHQLNEKKN